MIQKIILVVCFTIIAFSQEKDLYDILKVNEDTYIFTRVWAERSRTNMVVIKNEKSFALINTMRIGSVKYLEKELKKIADLPVKYVINSNWDWHNTEANKYFADKGAQIISHENLQYFTNAYTQIRFKDEITIPFGKETIYAYKSYGHSFGHVNIHLKNANLIYMSDSYRNQWMTKESEYGNKGAFKGIKSAIALADENTLIVPGNTTKVIVNSKEDLIKELQIRKKFIQIVNEGFESGKTNEEISNSEEVQQLFQKNYDKYPEYKRGIKYIVQSQRYYNRMNKPLLNTYQLQKYTGEYQLPNGNTIEVFVEDDILFARSKGLFYLRLVPKSDTHFYINPMHEERYVIFKKDNNKIKSFSVSVEKGTTRFGQETFYTKLLSLGNIKRMDTN